MPHIPRIDELLAAEVDGSIDDDERRELRAHLDGCARCRAELETARTGRAALVALEDVDAPPDTASHVLGELEGSPLAEADGSWAAGPRSGGRERTPGARWRPFLAAAAAALVVLGVVVVVPRLGGEGGGSASTEAISGAGGGAADEAGEAAAPSPERPPGLERSDQDFDQEALAALAAQTTANARATGPVPTARELDEFAPALDCVERWADATAGGVALRVIEATYEGAPAYIGVFRVDTDPAKVVVWAVRQRNCDVIAVVSDRL